MLAGACKSKHPGVCAERTPPAGGGPQNQGPHYGANYVGLAMFHIKPITGLITYVNGGPDSEAGATTNGGGSGLTLPENSLRHPRSPYVIEPV